MAQQSLLGFNLAAPCTLAQRVIAETVSTSAGTVIDEFRDECERNRFNRVDVPPDQFKIRYLATVAVQSPAVDVFAAEGFCCNNYTDASAPGRS